jgi:hypothetical protein
MTITVPFGRKSRISRGLARAEELVRSSRYLEAIDVLSESNSLYPSTKAEARLIELRHEALFHMCPESALSSWPPNVEDGCFSTEGIPEVGRDEFDVRSLRSAIFNNGSLIVRNLISADEAQTITTDIDKAIENYDAAVRGEPMEDSAPWYVPFISSSHLPENEFSGWNADDRLSRHWVREGGGILAAESPRTFENLTTLLRRKSIISVVEEYLGERAALSVKKTTLRRVPCTLDTSSGWHQDGAFLGDGIRTVNLWIALTDCGIDAPTMDMVPKRLNEIAPTGTLGAAFDWSVSRAVVDELCGHTPPVRLQFKAGDAILFDEMNLHCTAVAQGMTKDRYAIEAWFFAPSCYPMDQLPLIV